MGTPAFIDEECLDEYNKQKKDAAMFLYKFIFSPNRWKKFNMINYKLKWEFIPFKPELMNEIPNEPGIYSFILTIPGDNIPINNYIMYIGRTTDQTLPRRVMQYKQRSHLRRRPKVNHLIAYYYNYLSIGYAICDQSKTKKIEKELINKLVPPCNDTELIGTTRQARGAF